MTDQPQPHCPWCNSNASVTVAGFRVWYCRRCGRQFDDSDDGEVGYGMPEKFVSRKEEFLKRNANRSARKPNHAHRR